MADLIAYWIFRYFESGDDRGYRMIEPYFHGRHGSKVGLIKTVTADTEARLQNLPPQPYPFPDPTVPPQAVAAKPDRPARLATSIVSLSVVEKATTFIKG